MLDKNPFSIEEFKGVNLGSKDSHFDVYHNDYVPFQDALDAKNIVYLKEGGFRTRPALIVRGNFSVNGGDGGVARQHWKIDRLGSTSYTDRWLYLTWDDTGSPDVGRFYDTGSATPTTPILTITNCRFASVMNVFGRLYISPLSDMGTPLAGSDGAIWVYDGTTARKAGGTRPTVGTMAVVGGAVGGANVTAGLHLASVAFETDSGFITPPLTPATWIQVTIAAGGGQAAQFTNVPVGPAGTVARHLLLSKVITNYDGIPENWELFFGLRIGDNTATSGNIIVPDTGLVDSADYLLDEFESLPACATISIFNGRLVYNGGNVDQRVTYVSKVADPETIDQTEDYIQIYEGIPDKILNGKELRGVYYIFKDTSTYVTNDNGGPPNSWEVNIVDSGLGLTPFGIAEVMANPGSLVLDNLIVGGVSGIYNFSGAYSPDPLSRKIQPLFKSATRAQLRYLRMAVDPTRKMLYVLLDHPDTSTDLWVGDYTNGLDPDNIKWSRWNTYTPTSTEEDATILAPIKNIVIDPNDTDLPAVTLLTHYAEARVKIQEADYTLIRNTFNPQTDWLYITGFTSSPLGQDYTFAYAIMRVLMKGADEPGEDLSFNFYLGTMDSDSAYTLEQEVAPGADPGKYINLPTNVVAQKVYARMEGYNLIQMTALHLMVTERAKLRSRNA